MWKQFHLQFGHLQHGSVLQQSLWDIQDQKPDDCVRIETFHFALMD